MMMMMVAVAAGAAAAAAGWRGPPCHGATRFLLLPHIQTPPLTRVCWAAAKPEPCVGTALAETRTQPHTSPMRISLWVSRGGKGGASPVAHLSMPASPWPEILLKGAAEDRQPGWSMRESRYFYFEKA